jgi:IS5 family transposase
VRFLFRCYPLTEAVMCNCFIEPNAWERGAKRRWQAYVGFWFRCSPNPYETTILRQFSGLNLDRIPDETTILNFRRLLEKHELAGGILQVINGYLGDRGLTLRQGTVVDATTIHAPSSTKNQDGKRDPDMHQTKKGNQYFFGIKVHIGVDAESGLLRSLVGTAANVADVTQADQLLLGEETYVCGDAGYTGVDKRVEHQDRQNDLVDCRSAQQLKSAPKRV